MRFSVPLAVALVLAPAARGQQHIAPTDPKTPADQQKSFTVPAGFEVQLVAAEPDIQKPIQSAFDAKGRLWITTSHHYPFAAPNSKATDKLYVLSDFGADGKAKTVQVFSDKLNIPIGILPLPDCKSCIVSSVGEILKLTDTDGDGKADKTEVLFTGFGTKDTHGMYNSFTLMPDGWVYACHGFSNESVVKGKDGHEVKMQSGNTFRFRPDGSRIEIHTRGQVNPFGMAVDPWFNLYTADCHSKPITQLIPGAVYQSFGKPHDGLGYAPHVTPHDHGSTALCGLSWYEADHFPKEYRGCLYLGNVVTNRVNYDRITWNGATPVAKELPDFLTSSDPWFRPADVKVGPDGALYITDFYNKIIGHYEVDLKHPGRDKDRGRVWRVVWKGKDGKAYAPTMPSTDLTTATADQLGKLLQTDNLAVKLLVAQQFVTRFPDEAKVRYPALTQADALGKLTDVTNAQTRRAAVEALAAHPHADNVKPLVELLKATPESDSHLRHAARIALRNALRDGSGWDAAAALVNKDVTSLKVLLPIIRGVQTKAGAGFLATQFDTQAYRFARHTAAGIPLDEYLDTLEFIGRFGDARAQDRILAVYIVAGDPGRHELALRVAVSLLRGVRAVGNEPTGNARDDTSLLLNSGLKIDAKPTVARPAVQLLGLLLDTTKRESDDSFKKRHADALAFWMKRADAPVELRAEALEIALRHYGSEFTEAIGDVLADQAAPVALREKLALSLAADPKALQYQSVREGIRYAMKPAPYRFQAAVASALSGSRLGADLLLEAVRKTNASPQLLQDRAILERLRAAKVPDLDKQLAELTKGLQPADQKLADLIKQRTTRFAGVKADKEIGAKLFAKNCAACHKIGDVGGKVGPNLDGIGNRGLERVLEDVLDPNRNVDAAFRARVLNLSDGTTKTGLMLRVEGEVVVMADGEGKEFRVPTKDIDSNRETVLSPMPANVGETVPEGEFFHLMAYLLDQRVKDGGPKKE